MESNIPQEIQDKINEMYGDVTDSLSHRGAAAFGYSLALPEIAALKEEVERLRGIINNRYNAV